PLLNGPPFSRMDRASEVPLEQRSKAWLAPFFVAARSFVLPLQSIPACVTVSSETVPPRAERANCVGAPSSGSKRERGSPTPIRGGDYFRRKRNRRETATVNGLSSSRNCRSAWLIWISTVLTLISRRSAISL